LVVLVACVLLVYENRQKTAEVARLQSLGVDANVNVPSNLQAQLDSERAVAGDLSAELETEQTRTEKLERELRELRSRLNEPEPSPTSKTLPAIRTITLRPDRTERDIRITSANGKGRTSVVIALPKTIADERVTIAVNGRTQDTGILVRIDATGNKSVSVTINDSDLKPGDNPISVRDDAGQSLVVYVLKVTEEK
jgi:hypothetical protein